MPGPSESEKPIEHGGAERTGEVWTADAPVETREAKRPSPRCQSIQIDFHVPAESLTVFREENLSFSHMQKVTLKHTVEDQYAEVAGEMIVAHARLS